MTKQEFELRAIEVSSNEFEAINEVYMNSDLDKDEFCNQWCKMNKVRVAQYKEAEKKRKEAADLRWKISEIDFEKLSKKEYEIADNVLSKRDKALLKKAGIELENKYAIPYVNTDGVIDYLPKMKMVYEIRWEVRRYLQTA